jgi:hypothetical protein
MTERRDWLGAKMATGYNHVHRIQTEHDTLVNGQYCRVFHELNSATGYLSLKVDCGRPASPEWSIHAGEALYQFRSVLDNLACLLTEKNGNPIGDHTEFPIFLERDRFWNDDGSLKKSIGKRIGGMSHQDQVAVEREQPFNRIEGPPEDDPLWLLYQLSNYDRHQFVQPMVLSTSNGWIEFRPPDFARHVTQVSTRFGPFDGETEIARYSVSYDGPEIALAVESHAAFDISFGNEGPAAGRLVIPTLKSIGLRVVTVLAKLSGIELPSD